MYSNNIFIVLLPFAFKFSGFEFYMKKRVNKQKKKKKNHDS